jgi:hypothetical protein
MGAHIQIRWADRNPLMDHNTLTGARVIAVRLARVGSRIGLSPA